jgi:hypothetical protein
MTSIKKDTKPETKDQKKSRLRAKEFHEAFKEVAEKLWKDKTKLQDSYWTDIEKKGY